MAGLYRSLLFVPGDSERKQAKALATSADVLILDLEDSVAASQLPAARVRVRELLQSKPDRSRQQLWVRVNSLSSGLLLQDLVAVFGAGAGAAGNAASAASPGAGAAGPSSAADGIVLPKVSEPAEIEEVAHYLAALEASRGAPVGSTKLIVIATETPQSLLSLPQLPGALRANPAVAQRLVGLTWGSEDLGAALGVRGKVDASGTLTLPFQLARTACLLASTSLGVHAIDGVQADFRNVEGLRHELENARRDGFSGKLAIHPDQVALINLAFSPTEAETEWARRVVAAFADAPDAGVVNLDGHMVDRPHLVQARRILDAVDPQPGSAQTGS